MPSRDRSPRKWRPTSYDVARAAGVSQSVVSRVFTPGARVGEQFREKVLDAARRLGYRPNAIARSLIKGRSNLVGVLQPSTVSLYYPEVTIEVAAAIASRGARVLLITADTPAEAAAALEDLWSFRVDGLVAMSPLTTDQLDELEQNQIPVVFYNRTPPRPAANAIAADDAEAESRLVDRLWAAGHRRFALIRGPEQSDVAQQRARGGLDRLMALGGEVRAVARGDYRYESGVEAFGEIWGQCGGALDAVLCVNDAMALGAIDAARLVHGLQLPEQISIVGFDGFSAGRWLSYQLATVRQPVRIMANAAIEMIFARIADRELAPERRIFGCEVIPGGSARLAP